MESAKKHCKILFSTCSAVSFPSSLCVTFAADIFDGVLDQLLQVVIMLHCRFNVADGVDNGGVVTAAEFSADRLQGHLGDLTDHIDRHLAGGGNLAGAFAAAKKVNLSTVEPEDLLSYEVFRYDGRKLSVAREDVQKVSETVDRVKHHKWTM